MKAKIYLYSLPFKSKIFVNDKKLKTRDGLLIYLQNGKNNGWGEISPLIGFSKETLNEAITETIVRLNEWLDKKKISESCFPSVSFGCSCALAEITNKLPLKTNYLKAFLFVDINIDKFILNLNFENNLKIVKFKLGIRDSIKDGLYINHFLKLIPELRLRLDVNRSWNLFQANNFIKNIDLIYRNRIDFIEEPCKTREESLQFAIDNNVNIAWDESVREADFIIEKQCNVSAIIIKPMLTGSLSYCRFLIECARKIGLQSVISSSFESSFGLTQLSRIAYWLTPNVIPGLDTVSSMKMQLLRSWPGCNLPIQQLESLKLIWES